MITKLSKNWRIYFLIFLTLLAIAVWSTYLNEPDNKLHIYTLDVGQGDAILIQKQNYQILIDGGPDSSVIEQLAKVMPIEDREIELLILTHPHADHVAGLVDVLKRFKVQKAKYSGIEYESNIYREFINLAKEKNIDLKIPKTGDTESVLETGVITFLWPGDEVKTYKDNLNNTSEVFKFDYGNFSGIFSADCEVECWQGIVKSNSKIISNVAFLKVAHHGSKNGTTNEIVTIIKPKIAVISLAKDNKYGFPHKEAIELLQKIGAAIYRTDLLGTIDLSTDGNTFQIN